MAEITEKKAMEKQDIWQRRLYAEERMVIAIDRLLEAQTDSERKMASKWAHAWRDFSEGRNRGAVSPSDVKRR
jgi:hypothetical protein